MTLFSELGIRAINGTYSKKEGVKITAIELADAWLVKRKVERVEFVPKRRLDSQ